MIQIVILSLILALQTASPAWEHTASKDAISNDTVDLLMLKGKFISGAPGFPYRDAVPTIVVGCLHSEWKLTAIDFGAPLDPGDWPIKNRIDDVQGEFTKSVLMKPITNAVYITKADFGKIMRADKVIVRLRLFPDRSADAEFDLSVDFSKVKEKCPK